MIHFSYRFGTAETLTETYCFGLPEAVPDSFVIGNSFEQLESIHLRSTDTAPETNRFRSNFGQADIVPEAEHFGKL
jgi:hypothetical protein